MEGIQMLEKGPGDLGCSLGIECTPKMSEALDPNTLLHSLSFSLPPSLLPLSIPPSPFLHLPFSLHTLTEWPLSSSWCAVTTDSSAVPCLHI